MWHVFDVVVAAPGTEEVAAARHKVHGCGTPAARQARLEEAQAVRRATAGAVARGGAEGARARALRHKAAGMVQAAYHPGYRGPVEARGGVFHAVVLSPFGGWHAGALGMAREALHSGDREPACDLEAERFDHHARTWAGWNHRTFTVQMVACRMASAAWVGVRRAAVRDLADASAGAGAACAGGWVGGVVGPPEVAGAA